MMEWTNSFDVCLELHMTAAKKISLRATNEFQSEI